MEPVTGEVKEKVEINDEQLIEAWKIAFKNRWASDPCNWTLCINSLLLTSGSAYKGNIAVNIK